MAAFKADDAPRPMGRLGSAYGLKGWIKVQSFASQPEDLFDYSPWYIRRRGGEWREVRVEEFRPHNQVYVVKLDVASTPEEAKSFAGMEIGIRRSSLPPLSDDEIYLQDLIGCEVIGIGEVKLGKVSRIWDQGASPIMEVSPSDRPALGCKNNILIPYVAGPIVTAVDLSARTVRVEWGEDY